LIDTGPVPAVNYYVIVLPSVYSSCIAPITATLALRIDPRVTRPKSYSQRGSVSDLQWGVYL